MEIVPSSLTVAQFCESMDEGTILVNWDYQRDNEVWPKIAQSFLIETILLNFPIPKLFLHQQTDRISRKTVHYIVDGQQRSKAIKDFYDGELRLDGSLESDEARGRTYDELPDEMQSRFLSYGLGLDLFVNASEKTMREVFRRINSHEVPLNAEEQRHARYQGDFKWYIYHLSHRFDHYYDFLGMFSSTQLVRMQDMKWLSEITHALLYGITTTNKKSLNDLYANFDEEFKKGPAFTKQIEAAMKFIAAMDFLPSTDLRKSYSMYSLVLAAIHAKSANPKLESAKTKGGRGLAPAAICERRLSTLAAALEAENPPRKLQRFVKAAEKGTNVKAKRKVRFEYFLDAISRDGGKLLPKQ